MKKKSLFVGLLVVAVMAGYTTPASAWDPVPDAAGCPPTTVWDPVEEAYVPYNWANTIVRTPGIALSEYSDVPWAPAPVVFRNVTQYPYDFCGYFDIIFCSLGPVAAVIPDVGTFAFLVQCLTADLNGPLDLEAELPVTGNGIPDGQYELGIVAAVLNDLGHPLNAAATAGFQEYFVNIKNLIMEALYVYSMKSDDKDVRGILYAAAPYLVSPLAGVLSALAVMGDDTTNEALDAVIGLLSAIGLEPPEGGIGSLGTPVPELGPNGDVDGGGASNMAEYLYYVVQEGYSLEAFLDAVFDPLQEPPVPTVIITGPVPSGKPVGIGTNVTLSATVNNTTAISYQWFKGAALLTDQTGSALQLSNVQVADSGVYKVEVTVNAKATEVISATYTLTVIDIQLPVGGTVGLVMLAGACAMAGVAGLRRRK
jgi:hypothetical protein